MHVFVIIVIGILGLIIGSFLNVIILRINTGRGLGGRSACFSCNKTLRWYELIPVISFAVQGGKCNSCKSKISWQYPLVELITALLFAGVAARFDVFNQPVTLVLWLLLVSLGMIIATYDVLHQVIPTMPLVLFFGTTIALGMHSIGFLLVPLPFLILWLISQGKWIGFGDIEIMACIGMLLGITAGISAVVISFWIACLIILPIFGIQKMRHKKMSHEIPFGPFLLLGTYMVAIGGFDILTMLTSVVK